MNMFASPSFETTMSTHSPSNTSPTRDQQDPKPKPSLSSYNLFFKVERKRILEGTDQDGTPVTVSELRQTIQEHKNQGKRQHRKTHGKIGFRELARAIATRWKTLDATTKQLLEDQAQVEKEAYATELEAWKARNPLQAQEEEMSSSSKKTSKKNVKKSQEVSDSVSPEPVKMPSPPANHSIDRIQALMHVRAKIQAEMQVLSERSRNALMLSAEYQQPIQQQQAFMPAFYSPVDTQETFSRNFFDQEEEGMNAPKDLCLDNFCFEQNSLMDMFTPSMPNTAEAADLFQPFQADIQTSDFYAL